jgi:hypothetical protein
LLRRVNLPFDDEEDLSMIHRSDRHLDGFALRVDGRFESEFHAHVRQLGAHLVERELDHIPAESRTAVMARG